MQWLEMVPHTKKALVSDSRFSAWPFLFGVYMFSCVCVSFIQVLQHMHMWLIGDSKAPLGMSV